MATKIQKNPEQPMPGEVQAQPQSVDMVRLLAQPGKYEVTENDSFTVKVPVKLKENRWVISDEPFGVEVIEVVFRMWTFDEAVELKRLSLKYDPDKRIHFVDNDQLNQMKIRKLLRSWTFDKENPRLRLLHQAGVLTDEGWNAFRKLHPNIATFIIDQMNQVLEYNG